MSEEGVPDDRIQSDHEGLPSPPCCLQCPHPTPQTLPLVWGWSPGREEYSPSLSPIVESAGQYSNRTDFCPFSRLFGGAQSPAHTPLVVHTRADCIHRPPNLGYHY